MTTTLGWSIIGNFAGIAAVQYLESKKYSVATMRIIKKREFIKVGAFFGTVALFTAYGYGSARQTFVRQKLDIVQKYSIEASDK